MEEIVRSVKETIKEAEIKDEYVVVSFENFNALVDSVRRYQLKRARYMEKPVIRAIKCLYVNARSGKRNVQIIVEPGDRARCVYYQQDKITVETEDPARLRYCVHYCEENITWEYCHGS